MHNKQPPEDYETLIRLIHDEYDGMSKTYQRIAEYLTQNPNDVAIMPVNSIAETCGIHASSFVRFAQKLGYAGFKDLQVPFQRRLSTAAPGFEARVKALETDLAASNNTGTSEFLKDLVVRDIASLQALMNTVQIEDLEKSAAMLEKAETVFLLGQLRSAPVANLLHYLLTMLGKRTILLDESGGFATHRAKLATTNDLLVCVAFRFYANEVVNIAEETHKSGVPVLAITDTTLSPLAKNADQLFVIPEHEYTFSRSLAAPMCLAQSIALALAARVQSSSKPRIPIVTTR